jgi:hypothetical protein
MTIGPPEPPIEETLDDQERPPRAPVEPAADPARTTPRGQPDEPPSRGPTIERDPGPDEIHGV